METSKTCPSCGTSNYLWRSACGVCGSAFTPGSQKQLPANAASLPLVLSATDEAVDDIATDAEGKPVGKAYTARVPRRGDVPGRDFDRGYLLARVGDMVAGEGRYGVGRSVLAEQAPYIYSKARIGASLRGVGCHRGVCCGEGCCCVANALRRGKARVVA